MTRNVFSNFHLRTDFFLKVQPVVSQQAKRTLRRGGVLKMRERDGKKQLRPPTRTFRSLACNRLHFEEKSDANESWKKYCVS